MSDTVDDVTSKGRPTPDEALTVITPVRLGKDQRERLAQAAKKQGVSLGRYLRDAAEERADREERAEKRRQRTPPA